MLLGRLSSGERDRLELLFARQRGRPAQAPCQAARRQRVRLQPLPPRLPEAGHRPAQRTPRRGEFGTHAGLVRPLTPPRDPLRAAGRDPRGVSPPASSASSSSSGGAIGLTWLVPMPACSCRSARHENDSAFRLAWSPFGGAAWPAGSYWYPLPYELPFVMARAARSRQPRGGPAFPRLLRA